MRIKPTKKEYKNDELTIVWQPHKCIHSEKCWRGLPEVFRYGKKPWVNTEGASSSEIKSQIDQCPSGALSYYLNAAGPQAIEADGDVAIQVVKNGPLLVKGNIKFTHPGGEETIEKNPALCRCGGSGNKPFCDGSHSKNGFEG